MKHVVFLVISLTLVACGKNAFVEAGDQKVRSLNPSTPGDDGNGGDPNACKPMHVKLDPVYNKDLKHDHMYPFDFTPIRQNKHTEVRPDFGNKKIVDYAQVVLPFEFDELEDSDAEINKIYLTFDTYQFYDSTWMHFSQICHNYNKNCSGDEDDVSDHLNHHVKYNWIDDNFSNYVKSFPAQQLDWKHYERSFSGEVDLYPLFYTDIKLTDLPDGYWIVIADNHLIKNAKLNIEYCSKQ